MPLALEHHSAPVIGLISDGDHFRAIRVKCPFCRGHHVHRWSGRDDLDFPFTPYCGTPSSYRVAL